MSTFTAIALDRLLEPGTSRSATKPPSDPKNVHNSKLERRNSTPNTMAPATETNMSMRSTTTVDKKFHWAQPKLYATPETTPLPDSPSSFPPSPYIINHKRRGPRLLKSFSEDDVSARQRALDEGKVNGNVTDAKLEVSDSTKEASDSVGEVAVPKVTVEEEIVNGFHDGEVASSFVVNGMVKENDLLGNGGVVNGTVKENDSVRCVSFGSERDGESEDFYDPQDSMSMTSNTEGEDVSGPERSFKLTTPMGEFYDAWEELSSEGGAQSSLRDIEAELREIRLSLLMEIEKRKQAEEALNSMRNQWRRIREQLSLVGLTLPVDPTAVLEDGQVNSHPAEDLCQQVYVARFVSDSLGRATAKAELEMEMEAQIESKNFEIARLWDRLHYYEAVNHEMSQRNQESVEMARRHRQIRKRRQMWVWGSVAAAITLGTAALAWSYLPAGKGSFSANDSSAPEHDDAAK